ncbi:hypothetical protein [Paraburkholderia sp. SOS3]|jgi:hypothetical protein|uniref:hypothetical protein n=1 Tax=Paraburkholderia sp. SOS3 TaxID=1926494 RepID=UPI0009473A83|nr:hypothetical protein [Paraburkholderia sp. SOS3]APR35838.1 hypothetical protein BTO02_10865 [Paraburkholderia sp. SOS3]
MSIMTIRTSDTEVQVEQTVYTFAKKDEADAFQRCVADRSIDTCNREHPPLSLRPATPEMRPDDPNRDSTISPTVGGTPL